MSRVLIDFTYSSRLGSKFCAQAEALDYDQAGDLVTSVIDWCESCGFKMECVKIRDIETKEGEKHD